MHDQPLTLKIVHKMRTSMTGMTAAMIMAARDVDGMYWKRELSTARASRTTLPKHTYMYMFMSIGRKYFDSILTSCFMDSRKLGKLRFNTCMYTVALSTSQ